MKEERMTRKLFKATIVAMRRQMVTRASFLEVVDDDKGPLLIPCEGTPLVTAFHKAFGGGVIVGGEFNNDGIAGEKIAYRLDEKGFLSEFIHEASPKTTWFVGGGSSTRGGFLPPDHWLYGAGPIVAGRAILKLPKSSPEKKGGRKP
jgi:hypothetical protein